MLNTKDKKRSAPCDDQQENNSQIKRLRKSKDEQDLVKWLNRQTGQREVRSHRLKRQSALVGNAFVAFWDRNKPQVEMPSLGRKIESFSINFATGENRVTYANGQQDVTFVNQR